MHCLKCLHVKRSKILNSLMAFTVCSKAQLSGLAYLHVWWLQTDKTITLFPMHGRRITSEWKGGLQCCWDRNEIKTSRWPKPLISRYYIANLKQSNLAHTVNHEYFVLKIWIFCFLIHVFWIFVACASNKINISWSMVVTNYSTVIRIDGCNVYV